MAKMSLKPDLRRPNPLSAWREAHGLTLAQLAEKLGVTVGAVHQIEDELAGNYNRAWLEALADLYRRQPADLIKGPPGQADPFIDLWGRLSEPQRQRVLAFVEGMIADQPPSPAPQPALAAPSGMVTSRLKRKPENVIGGARPPHVYLQEWLDHRNMEPERLAQRLYVDVEVIQGLLDGSEPYDQEILWHIAKALTTSLDSLYGLPPAAERKPAKKDGKKAAKGR